MLIGSDYQVSAIDYTGELYAGLFDRSVLLKEQLFSLFQRTFTAEAKRQHTTSSCCTKTRRPGVCLVVLNCAVHETRPQRKGVREFKLFLYAAGRLLEI